MMPASAHSEAHVRALAGVAPLPGVGDGDRDEASADKPRLLIVGPLPKQIGGVEIFTELILKSEAFDGFEVAHYDTTKNRPKQTQGRFDVANAYWAVKFFAGLWTKTRRFRPDVVYMPVGSSWSGFCRDGVLAKIAKMSGARVVGHVHGGRIERILTDKRRSAFVSWALSQWDMLIPLGDSVRGLFEKRGYAGELNVVPSTVRPELLERGAEFERTAKQAGPVQGLFVGQVGRRKGVYDLLHAMAMVKKAGVSFHLKFVGPAEYAGEWDSLLRLRSELDLTDVTEFVGPQTGDALIASYEEADVLLMPSYKEGMPAVFHEAGAFGLPVIATPVGAVTDLVRHGRNGLLVEPGDIEQIAGSIRMMAADADARVAMGQQLRRDVSSFHPDKVCRKVAKAVTDCARLPVSRNTGFVATVAKFAPVLAFGVAAPFVIGLAINLFQPQDLPLGTTQHWLQNLLFIASKVRP